MTRKCIAALVLGVVSAGSERLTGQSATITPLDAIESLIDAPRRRVACDELAARVDVTDAMVVEFMARHFDRRTDLVRAGLDILVVRGNRARGAREPLDRLWEELVGPMREGLARKGQPFSLSVLGSANMQLLAIAREAVELPASASLSYLRPRLTSPEPEVRLAAALKLARLGSDAAEVLPELLRMVDWTDGGAADRGDGSLVLVAHLRRFAYEAIAEVAPGHPATVRGLILALQQSDPLARRQAALAIGALGAAGAPAVGALMEMARSRDVAVAGDAVTALGMVGAKSSALRRVLRDLSKHEDAGFAARVQSVTVRLFGEGDLDSAKGSGKG